MYILGVFFYLFGQKHRQERQGDTCDLFREMFDWNKKKMWTIDGVLTIWIVDNETDSVHLLFARSMQCFFLSHARLSRWPEKCFELSIFVCENTSNVSGNFQILMTIYSSWTHTYSTCSFQWSVMAKGHINCAASRSIQRTPDVGQRIFLIERLFILTYQKLVSGEFQFSLARSFI